LEVTVLLQKELDSNAYSETPGASSIKLFTVVIYFVICHWQLFLS
jgi:hypothetical protein